MALKFPDTDSALAVLRSVAGTGVDLVTWINQLITRVNTQTALSVPATNTITIAGAPTLGDVYVSTFTLPDGTIHPVTSTLGVADAVSATTAALRHLTDINTAFPAAQYGVVASQVAGVITATAKRKGTGFNAATLVCTKTGVGTLTAGALNFASGTGLDDLVLCTQIDA